MKNVCIVFVIGWLLLSGKASAQAIPLELMSGNTHYYQQFSIYRPIQGRLGFFNTSSLMLMYDKCRKPELMSQSYITFRLSETLKAGLGTFYASAPGLSPSLSLQFGTARKQSRIITALRTDLRKNPSFDIMTAFEAMPRLNEHINLYMRAQVMFNFDIAEHNRSYQYLRLGFEKGKHQYGLALNMDAYGPDIKYYQNWGVFYKISI